MKTTLRSITCGATALIAALALQAQSSTTSSSSTPDQQKASSTGAASVSPGSSTTGSATSGDTTWRSIQSTEQNKSGTNSSGSLSGSASGSASGSLSSSSDRPTSGSSSSTSAQTGTSGIGTQANTQSSQQSSLQSSVLSAQSDAEITTVVQQIDAQGPVVVERISTSFVDTACNEENARALVEALHSGGSVTLKGEDGKTATFNVSQKLGYGDAFIALSLAEEALRQAGITGCATPEQWQAVLVGGELKGGTTVSTTTTTERFPGVLVLRQQHGGWAQVAQTTNVQLNTVVASAQSSLNLEAPTSNLPPRSGFTDDANKSEADKKKDKDNNASARGQEKGYMKGQDDDWKQKEKARSDGATPRASSTGSSSASPNSAASGSATSSDTEDPEGKRDSKQGQPDQPPRGY